MKWEGNRERRHDGPDKGQVQPDVLFGLSNGRNVIPFDPYPGPPRDN